MKFHPSAWKWLIFACTPSFLSHYLLKTNAKTVCNSLSFKRCVLGNVSGTPTRPARLAAGKRTVVTLVPFHKKPTLRGGALLFLSRLISVARSRVLDADKGEAFCCPGRSRLFFTFVQSKLARFATGVKSLVFCDEATGKCTRVFEFWIFLLLRSHGLRSGVSEPWLQLNRCRGDGGSDWAFLSWA